MNFYWIYDLPNWQFFIVCMSFFVGFALLGAFLFRQFFENWMGLKANNNDIVGNFLSVSGLFYGITLGLISVGTFENFQAAESAVSHEASALNGLYRDVNLLENAEKNDLKILLKDYAYYMVGEGWKLQQKGELPKGTSKIVNRFEAILAAYKIENEKDKIIFAEVVRQNNKLSEARRERVNIVQQGLPAAVWLVLFVGAFVVISLTWFLVIDNKKLDVAVNVLCGMLMGSLIFLIAAMDNPFRGEFSVSSQPFQLLIDGVMKQ
jgi:TRAP-type C4-dicarboxylate transport system permease small subunit